MTICQCRAMAHQFLIGLAVLSSLFTASLTFAVDVIISQGRFYTPDQAQTWAEAVVIEDGKFVFVGSNDEAITFATSDTRLYQLNGKTVLPGLVDSHTHPGFMSIYGHGKQNLFLPYPASTEQVQQSIKQHIIRNPKQKLIFGGYWKIDQYGLSGPKKE